MVYAGPGLGAAASGWYGEGSSISDQYGDYRTDSPAHSWAGHSSGIALLQSFVGPLVVQAKTKRAPANWSPSHVLLNFW